MDDGIRAFLGIYIFTSGHLKAFLFSDTLAQKSYKTQSAGFSFLMNNQSRSINQQGTG